MKTLEELNKSSK